jgi:replicative DNA helicase
VASLTDSLERELGPLPSATKAPTHRKPLKSGGDLFSRANSVETVALLDWLGIQHESTSRGVMAVCPGCGEDGALVCKDGGLKCLHQRCADAGPTDKPGFRTNLDIAIKVRGYDAVSVAQEIVQHFGKEREFKKQERRPDFDELDPADVEAEEINVPREPGDDTAEIKSEPTQAQVVPISDAKMLPSKRLGVLSMQQLMMLVYDELQKERPRRGVPTGCRILDEAIGGWRRGNITVLGAKRSFGKTSFSIHTADTAINLGYRVLLLAGEDSAMMYGQRWLARRAGLSAMKVRDFEATRAELGMAAQACAAAPTIPFFLRVAGQPVEWIASAIRQLAKEHAIDLVIADYLQCIRMGGRTQDRRNEVTLVTKELVTVIREVNAAGLLLSQLKRTDRVRPEIEDLKESGDIEDMADHVLLGFKEEEPRQHDDPIVKRKLILAKNKDGPDDLDDIELEFSQKTASFRQSDGYIPPGGEDYDPSADDNDYSARCP